MNEKDEKKIGENYKAFVEKRGVVARHLSKRSAETIVLMWEYKGFIAEAQHE